MSKPNFAALVLFLISFEMRSDIKIDGVLNEEEWESARVVEQFYEVYPYTSVSYTHLRAHETS